MLYSIQARKQRQVRIKILKRSLFASNIRDIGSEFSVEII